MRTTSAINLRNNWHHADHIFNQPAEQLASCGLQLQSTCGTIGIMRTTTSIKLRNNWHHVDHNCNKPAEQSKFLLQFLCRQLGTNLKFYFNFYVDSLAPIESSTSICTRTAWHQSKVLLQLLCGQLGTNRKFYFNFYADSLAQIESSTSFFYPDSLAPIESPTSIFTRTAWHKSKFLFQSMNYSFHMLSNLDIITKFGSLHKSFWMRFSDVLSQNTVPTDSSTLRLGFPMSSAKFRSNFDNVSDPYAIWSVSYPIHTVSDPYTFWFICYPIHICDPFHTHSNFDIITTFEPWHIYFECGFPMSSAKFQFNFDNVSDPYAMQSIQ